MVNLEEYSFEASRQVSAFRLLVLAENMPSIRNFLLFGWLSTDQANYRRSDRYPCCVIVNMMVMDQ